MALSPGLGVFLRDIDRASLSFENLGKELAVWGRFPHFAIPDELPQALELNPIAVYDAPDFPLARVEVRVSELDRWHPRNPNPQAGPITVWTIHAGGKKVGNHFTVCDIAKHHAQRLHKKLVDGLVADRYGDAPLYGSF